MTLCINNHCRKPENLDKALFCESCGSELLLKGRYRVANLLGRGGFANTYEVISRNGTPQVMKVLIQTQPKAVSLFQQEVQVLSQLDCPGIPKGHEYFTFVANNNQEQLHCLVMEKIEGMNLEQYMQQRHNHPIDQQLAVEWLRELVTILQVVHQQNFFHRDIKPTNIMLKGDGQLVLIDFGAAREVTGTYVIKQPLGQVTGINSPGYTPPEQLNGQAVLPSDFFALGRTFVYLLTGKTPNDPNIYNGNTDEVLWRNYASQVWPIFADLIDDLMKRSPSLRPQSTQVILQRLAEIDRVLKTQPQNTTINPPPPKTTPPKHNITSRQSLPVLIGVGSAIATGALIMVVSQFFPLLQLGTPRPGEEWAKNLALADTLNGHSESVASVSISPDSKMLTSASHDATIKLWNLQTGQLLRPLYGHTLPVLSVAISPNGQNLVSGSLDETIKVWNLGNGQPIGSIKTDGYIAWSQAVAIAKDGQTLATGSTDKTVRLWNFLTSQRIRTFSGHSLPVLAVAISPNGQTLASGSTDKTVRLWNIATGQTMHTLSGHTSWVTCLTISPDNQFLISGSLDKTIKVWNLNTGELLRTLSGHSYSVLSLAITPDGQTLASGGLDGEIRLWNLENGKLLRTLSGHTKQVVSLAISQDGQTLVSGSADNSIKVWRQNKS